MFSGSPSSNRPNTSNCSPTAQQDVCIAPQRLTPPPLLLEGMHPQTASSSGISPVDGTSFFDTLSPTMANQRTLSEYGNIDLVNIEPSIFAEFDVLSAPDSVIHPTLGEMPACSQLNDVSGVTAQTTSGAQIPQSAPLVAATFTQPQPSTSQVMATTSQQRRYVSILPAIKTEPADGTEQPSASTILPHAHFAAFSAASEQLGKGVALIIKPDTSPSYEQPKNVTDTSDNTSFTDDKRIETGSKIVLIPDVLNPEKTKNIDILISHIENALLSEQLKQFVLPLPSKQHALSAFEEAAKKISDPIKSNRFMEAIKNQIKKETRKRKNRESAQNSRNRKKAHMENLEGQVVHLHNRLGEISQKTKQLEEALKGSAITEEAKLRLNELKQITQSLLHQT